MAAAGCGAAQRETSLVAEQIAAEERTADNATKQGESQAHTTMLLAAFIHPQRTRDAAESCRAPTAAISCDRGPCVRHPCVRRALA